MTRSFTLEEANALLPEIKKCLNRIYHKRDAHARHHDVLFMEQILAEKEGHPVDQATPSHLEREIQFMESNISALEADVALFREMGCLLRSVEKGHVDFPSHLKGEPVLLCWKPGEDKIAFYHAVDQEESDRKPLGHA